MPAGGRYINLTQINMDTRGETARNITLTTAIVIVLTSSYNSLGQQTYISQPLTLKNYGTLQRDFVYIGYNIFQIRDLNSNILKILIPSKMRGKGIPSKNNLFL